MKKIVFLAGMYGGKIDTFLVKQILKDFDIVYFPYDTSLTETIEQSALKLNNFIKRLNLKRNEKVGIISFSAGGIIAEYYLKFIDDTKVNKIVTVCSPFRGSWLSRIYFKSRKGLNELRTNSILLKKIREKKLNRRIKEKNFWCLFDPIVFGTSGKGDNPEHTLFFLHSIIQFWPPLIYRIQKFLNESI
jgi:triacylglycerol esterase/lipase EstA (alpha/beta hydrolase family)